MSNAKNHARNTPRLAPGTQVFSKLDGEAGTVVEQCAHRRNGSPLSYVVQTAYGTEIWNASEVCLPSQD